MLVYEKTSLPTCSIGSATARGTISLCSLLSASYASKPTWLYLISGAHIRLGIWICINPLQGKLTVVVRDSVSNCRRYSSRMCSENNGFIMMHKCMPASQQPAGRKGYIVRIASEAGLESITAKKCGLLESCVSSTVANEDAAQSPVVQTCCAQSLG